MLDKVKAAVERFGMLERGANVMVALSGGADSVALLHAMLELAGEYGVFVSACHVNHGLRGGESDGDERFVRGLCGGLNVPLAARSADVKSSRKKRQSLEEAAREARYSVLADVAETTAGRVKIATGHTASDNAETVLINLIRGSALKGLCGIPPVRGDIIRPLIFCSRADTEEFCRARGLGYVTDSANFSLDYTRNKIRASLIPVIEGINPSFAAGITRMCGALREDEEFISKRVEPEYGADFLRTLEKPLLRRAIGGLLSRNGISPSNLMISRVEEIVMAGKGKINVEKNKFAVVGGDVLKIMTVPQNYRKR
ncbi:MAG: tRNA lysidine(34) synthetase TilS [Oscillospiraceae bacterium]|jgi:tRNA(Ile)-lysidine synthase|nr:tRNA lysidine(34) synthetase TilS [Oscillospiraceae bacterium]